MPLDEAKWLSANTPADPDVVGGYQIRGRLGRGGMGQVYLGWASAVGFTAVKVIRADLTRDPTFRTRFRREAAALARVLSEFVPELVGYDVEADPPWITSVFCPAPTLAEVFASGGPVASATAACIGLDMAVALADIHAAGVVHRDIKPSNVLATADGLRVIDFGIAQTVDDSTLTAPGQSIGTPGFMAPEQLRRGEASPASDLFAVGGLIAAAVGARPFGSGNLQEVAYRVVYEPPDLTAVPEPLRRIVEACLEKEAAARPTPGALGAMLRRLLREQGADPLAGRQDLLERSARARADRAAVIRRLEADLAIPEIQAALTRPPQPARNAVRESAPNGWAAFETVPVPEPAMEATATAPGRPPLGHGRGSRLRAVAGLGVLAISAGAVALVVTLKESPAVPPTHANGSSTQATSTALPLTMNLAAVGVCMNNVYGTGSDVVADCATPHDAEITALVATTELAHATSSDAASACASRNAPIIARQPDPADFRSDLMYPATSAQESGDHPVVCFVEGNNQRKLTGALE